MNNLGDIFILHQKVFQNNIEHKWFNLHVHGSWSKQAGTFRNECLKSHFATQIVYVSYGLRTTDVNGKRKKKNSQWQWRQWN